ncbi:EAL domain-containing protein [Seleniivibrio woodruffii]|uniref:EAL domain-containing protein n=1 Tax=Seleniivibrio woodruffii TaxID=1078050 RepID=UPI00240A179E|nr:EAL domain-containing protein [Seleniivibrio woodruffii]
MLGKYLNENNIGRISLMNMVLVIVIITVAMILFIAKQTRNEYETERSQLVKNYIDSKKQVVNGELDRMFNMVDYYTGRNEEVLSDVVKNRVDKIVELTRFISETLNRQGKPQLLKYELAEYITKYSSNETPGNIYVIDSTGNVIYHPLFPRGTNLFNLKSPYGSYPIRSELEAVSEKGKFVDTTMQFEKDSSRFIQQTTYIRKIPGTDWYAGAAYSSSELKEVVKKQMMKRVETVRFDNYGHYFIINSDGTGIALPGNSKQEGKLLTDIGDSAGVKFYKELMSGSIKENNFYLFHSQNYTDWNKVSQVISSCRMMEQWGWLMCASVSIDDLTPIINERNAALNEKLSRNTRYSLILFIISATLAAGISWYFSRHVQLIFSKYKKDIENRNKDLEELNIELTNQLYTDHLTGLPNRNKLVSDLNNVKNPILILLNIDSFKKINETYGFIIGDFVLIDVGERIASFSTDVHMECYKFHGNEYAILADSDMDREELDRLLEKLSSHLDFTVKYDELEIEIDITLTAGVSAEKGNVFEKAGMAMRLAEKKKQPFIIYDSAIDMVDEYEKDIRWTKIVKRALNENNLVPFYQPIANSRTGKVEKFECLVRIIDNGEVITPFQFLDIIKKTKLYQHITKRVITKSFETFADNNFIFTINLSIEDIMDETTARFILDTLHASGIAERVVFELLESEGIESFAVVNDFIKELKKTGAMVAIDDFGSGYSNFVYLSELNVDIIKIDGSLIKNIDHDRQSQIIVETIIKFANQLNIRTVAEFVHSESVRRKVIDMGIDYIQGYHVGKPTASIKDYLN